MDLKQRTLVLNKRPVPVREATDLLAVRLPDVPKAAGKVTVHVGGEPVDIPALPLPRVAERLAGAEVAELERFRDARWVFVERAALPGVPDEFSAGVLVHPSGGVSLAPNRVTVKLKDAAADPAGVFPVGVVRSTPLKFAPGLYSVAFDPKGGMDALEVAGGVESTGRVEYAEPELLAFTGGRS